MCENEKEVAGLHQVAGELVVVRVYTASFSGKQAVQAADLVGATLPPADVFQPGYKQLLDPKALRPFPKLRQRAMRACLARGTRIFGESFAIPRRKWDAVAAELETIRKEWWQAVDSFIADYPRAVAVWADAHPEWKALLLSKAPAAESIRERFLFSVVPYAVGAVGEENGAAAQALAGELGGLADQMLAEVAQDATEALAASFQGKVEVTRRALRPVKAILDKIEGLAFVSSGCAPLVQYIQERLDAVPKTGPVEGRPLLGLRILLEWLSMPANPKRAFFGNEVDNTAIPVVPAEPEAPAPAPLPAVESVAAEVLAPAWAF